MQKFICANGSEATDSDMEPERKELTAGENEDHADEKAPVKNSMYHLKIDLFRH